VSMETVADVGEMRNRTDLVGPVGHGRTLFGVRSADEPAAPARAGIVAWRLVRAALGRIRWTGHGRKFRRRVAGALARRS
jgi:hypothetical protein